MTDEPDNPKTHCPLVAPIQDGPGRLDDPGPVHAPPAPAQPGRRLDRATRVPVRLSKKLRGATIMTETAKHTPGAMRAAHAIAKTCVSSERGNFGSIVQYMQRIIDSETGRARVAYGVQGPCCCICQRAETNHGCRVDTCRRAATRQSRSRNRQSQGAHHNRKERR